MIVVESLTFFYDNHQTGMEDASLFIAAAKTANDDIAVIYMPEGMEVKIDTKNVAAKNANGIIHAQAVGWLPET